jgi:Icc-related predicted phosphoesterase
MKFLVFGDNHSKTSISSKLFAKAKKSEVDLVVCLGDFSDWGVHTEEILESFEKFGKPVLVIYGNHEDPEEVEEVCKKHSFLHYVDLKFFEFGDVVFFSYGGGGFNHRDKLFDNAYRRLKPKFDEYKNKKLVCVLHGPIYGNKLDHLDYFGHVGSKSTLKMVKEQKPEIVVCGHLHETFGVVDRLGKTLLINPGPEGVVLEI